MEKRMLGNTGIEVTELCFGTLPMGPLQKNLEAEMGAAIVEKALLSGINFVDTAQMYRTYEPIRIAMERTGIRPVVASKSAQKTYEGMQAAVEEALEKLGIEYIDIFLLHAARDGERTFEIYADALKCLLDMKAAGKVRAVGVSTHMPKVAAQAAAMSEIDIVFPIINKDGRGIIWGTKEEMLVAIEKCAQAGKGVYLMKVLAGGPLISEFDAALKFARSVKGYASIALGMVAVEEVEFNVKYFNGECAELPIGLKNKKQIKVFSALCKSCGACINTCPNMAIAYDGERKACVDHVKCLTCGYCTPVCPEFAIRMV